MIPMRLGGFGLTLTTHIARSAFVAATGEGSLPHSFISDSNKVARSRAISTITQFMHRSGLSSEETEKMREQRDFTGGTHKAIYNMLQSSETRTTRDKHRLASHTTSGASIWLGSPYFQEDSSNLLFKSAEDTRNYLKTMIEHRFFEVGAQKCLCAHASCQCLAVMSVEVY